MVDSNETEQEERESPLRDGHDCKIRILYDNLNKKTKSMFIIINKHTHKTVVHVGPDCEVLSLDIALQTGTLC